MTDNIQHAIFTVLTSDGLDIPEDDVLTKGQDFAGLAVIKDGVDMLGRAFSVKAKEIKEKYLPNTEARIKMMQEKGEPGLPIDDEKHSFGKAAGWITGVYIGSVNDSKGKKRTALMMAVEWTKLGVELIKNKIMTNFSPVFNTDDKVVMGGSLTNYPANKDENGIPLFDAIRLSEEMSYLTEDSLDDQMRQVRKSFREAINPKPVSEPEIERRPWIAEVYDDHVIVEFKGEMWRVDYTKGEDDEISFSSFDDWKKVKKSWVEAAQDSLEQLRERFGKTSEGGQDMAKNQITLEGLSDEERANLMAQAQSAVLGEFGLDGDGADVASAVERIREKLSGEVFGDLVGMDSVRDTLTTQVEAALKLELENMENQMGLMLAAMTAEYRRKQEVSTFATQVCQGDEENAHGLPIKQTELEALLLSVDDDARAQIQTLLKNIWQRGPVSFATKGRDGDGYIPGDQELGEAEALLLAQAIENGSSIDEFFETTELGDPADFDLTKFVVEEE